MNFKKKLKDFRQVLAISFNRFTLGNALNADLDAVVKGDHDELLQICC